MRARSPGHLVALVSLLVFFLAGQAGVQGYVWCLGEDGHAVLEYAAGDSCGRGTSPQDGQDVHQGENPAHLAPGDHCGPCLDIPAALEATARRAHSSEHSGNPAARVATPPPPPLPASVRSTVVSRYPQPPPGLSQTLLFQRTVVLLN